MITRAIIRDISTRHKYSMKSEVNQAQFFSRDGRVEGNEIEGYLPKRDYLNRQYALAAKVQQVALTSNVPQRETHLGE